MGAIGSVDTQRCGGVTTTTFWTPRPPEASLAGWSYGSLKQHPVILTGERRGMGVPLGCRPPRGAICVMGLPERRLPERPSPQRSCSLADCQLGCQPGFCSMGSGPSVTSRAVQGGERGAVSSAVILLLWFLRLEPSSFLTLRVTRSLNRNPVKQQANLQRCTTAGKSPVSRAWPIKCGLGILEAPSVSKV